MQNDLDKLFWSARRALPRSFWGDFLPARLQADFRDLFGILPVAKAGDGYWQPRPWRGHRAEHLRLIVAVRAGDPYGGEMAGYGLPAWVERDPVSRLPTESSRLRLLAERALHGPDIVDLLCLPDWRMQRPPLRYSGLATALGAAIDGQCWEDRSAEPVLVVRNIRRWLAKAAEGACLPLGTQDEQAGLLRGLTGGILTEDVAHGQALQALMRRPVAPIPSIFVVSAEEAA
jgi:hypothetical protein